MMLAAAMVVIPFAVTPLPASAENLFDFFFGGNKQQRQEAPPQASFFADPTNGPQPPAQRARSPVASGSGPAFCVRSCDGKYFPLMRGAASPAQMCQAFCPASATKVFYGSNIDPPPAHPASAMPTARTPSPIARRCAPTAPAMAGAAPGSRRSISRSTTRCAPVTWLRRQRDLAYSGVGGRRPGRRLHADRILSGADRRGPRKARGDEGRARHRGDRDRCAAAGDGGLRAAAACETGVGEARFG